MRYTVLTYIFGGYEHVHEVVEKDPNADYVLVTDDPNLKSETWRVVYDPMPKHSPFAKCYEVRFHPFRYVETPIVVRIDGSIKVMKSLQVVVDEFEHGDYDRCVMMHPYRNTMAVEYNEWVKVRNYPAAQATKCLKAMERFGFDLQTKGMIQGCFEIVRNNQVNRDVNDMVFGLLCLMGTGKIERIDQTVTTFVIERFFQDIKLMAVEETIVTDGRLMQWHWHKSDRIIYTGKPIEPMMGGEVVKVWKAGEAEVAVTRQHTGRKNEEGKPKRVKGANRKGK